MPQDTRPRNDRTLLLITLYLIFAVTAVGQSTRGAIHGQVVDTAGAVLQGAQIELQPKANPAVSNALGNFNITDLAPGSYTVTISYLGFAPFTTTVNVVAGQVTDVQAVLKVASSKEEITVYADRQFGEAEAINRERTSPNILNVLPADVITSLPNVNIADAIGRLPSVTLERDEGEGKYVQIRGTEPRLSNVTINGIVIASPEASVRQIKLDIIPADLVQSVEINKTLSADQDADAIGGSVNLVTKTAGEQPYLSFSGLGGYTPILNGRGMDQFTGTFGKRFGHAKKLGVLIGGSYDWNGRGIDDIEPAPTTIQCDPGNCLTPGPNAPYFATYNTMDLREYRYYRTRFGFAGGADYKLGEGSGVYLRGLYSHFDNFGDRWVYTPTINSFTTQPYQGGTDGTMTFNAEVRRPVETVGSIVMGGKHLFSSSWLSWELSTSRSTTHDQGYSTATFSNADPAAPINNVQFLLDRSNPYRPKFVVQNGVNIYDPTQYYLQGSDAIDNQFTYSPQINLQGGASYAKNYKLGSHFSTFQFGGLFRSAHKFQDAQDNIYSVNDPVGFPMTMFLSGFHNSNYYDGTYTLGPLTDYGKIRSFFNNNPNAFSLDYSQTRQQNDPNNFDLVEHVSAGYLMNTIDFGKFRLQTGVRFEATSENVQGYHVTIDSNGNYVSTSPLHANSSYLNVLPSAQLRYALTDNSAIRLAYGQGIARPNFGDLPPYVTQDDAKMKIDVGNPYLKATRANNYDVLYEQYLKPLGFFQAGFFYKDLYNPIYVLQTPIASGVYAGFTQTQPVNGPSAKLFGFEISYQQQLTFLPGILSGGGIAANYSYTNSTAYGVPGRSDTPPLLRQAPNTWNISPTYDHNRLSVRVGITHNGAYIFQYNYTDGAPLGPRGPNGDNYLYEHTQVDAQGVYRVGKGFSVLLAGLNLNNATFGFYQGSAQYPIQREYYHPTFQLGVRWSSGEK